MGLMDQLKSLDLAALWSKKNCATCKALRPDKCDKHFELANRRTVKPKLEPSVDHRLFDTSLPRIERNKIKLAMIWERENRWKMGAENNPATFDRVFNQKAPPMPECWFMPQRRPD